MTDMKQIHDFSVKWCDEFRDQNILNGDILTIGHMMV